jgi:hypothetical protein
MRLTVLADEAGEVIGAMGHPWGEPRRPEVDPEGIRVVPAPGQVAVTVDHLTSSQVGSWTRSTSRRFAATWSGTGGSSSESSKPGARAQDEAASISAMFLVTTSMVRPSSSVGLNSTTSVPA